MKKVLTELFREYDYEIESRINKHDECILATNDGGVANFIVADLTKYKDLNMNDAVEIIHNSLNESKLWDSSMMKNTTVLLLKELDIDGVTDFLAEAQEIEENKFLFKKHVLIYTAPELGELKSQYKSSDYSRLRDFMSAAVTEAAEFKSFKEGANLFGWFNLVMKMLVKMPFIEMKVTSNEYVDVSILIDSQIKKKNLEAIKSFSLELSEKDSISSLEAKINKLVKDE